MTNSCLKSRNLIENEEDVLIRDNISSRLSHIPLVKTHKYQYLYNIRFPRLSAKKQKNCIMK